MRSDLIDIDVIYQHETEKAVCIREDENSEDVWLPKSQCEVDGDRRRGGVVTLTAPERTLLDKGLI
jgi:hypothetical protein